MRNNTGKVRRTSEAWAKKAPELAQWARHRLVNRTDAWGAYRPLEEVGKGYVGHDGKIHKLGPQTTRKGVLDEAVLARHFEGRRRQDLIGLHSTSPDNTSLWGGIDIDAHEGGTADSATNLAAALAWFLRLEALGFSPLLSDSNGKGGYHLLALFDAPVPTPKVFGFLRWLIADHRQPVLAPPPATFPKQPRIKPGGFGNWLRVVGRHHTATTGRGSGTAEVGSTARRPSSTSWACAAHRPPPSPLRFRWCHHGRLVLHHGH